MCVSTLVTSTHGSRRSALLGGPADSESVWHAVRSAPGRSAAADVGRLRCGATNRRRGCGTVEGTGVNNSALGPRGQDAVLPTRPEGNEIHAGAPTRVRPRDAYLSVVQKASRVAAGDQFVVF